MKNVNKFLFIALVGLTTLTSCEKEDGIHQADVDSVFASQQAVIDRLQGNFDDITVTLSDSNARIEVLIQGVSDLDAAIASLSQENAEIQAALESSEAAASAAADAAEATIDSLMGQIAALQALVDQGEGKAKDALIVVIKTNFLFLYNPNSTIVETGEFEIIKLNDDKSDTVSFDPKVSLATISDDQIIESYESFKARAYSNK